MTRKALLGMLLLLFAVFSADLAEAAKRDRLFDVGGTFVGESENDDDAIATEIERVVGWVSGKVPIRFDNGNALVLGIHYEGQSVDYQNFAPQFVSHPSLGGPVFITENDLPDELHALDASVGPVFITENDLPDELHALDASVGLLWKWNKEWKTLFQVKPGIHSDFEDVDDDDWIISGSILAQRQLGGKSRWGIGAAYSDSFGDAAAFPLLMYDWYPNDKWFVEALLPLNLYAGYNVSSSFSVGIEGLLKGYEYRLTEDAPWRDSVILYREVLVGPFLDYEFAKNAHIKLSGGAVVGQNFELRDKDNEDEIVDGDYENTFYATLSIYVPF